MQYVFSAKQIKEIDKILTEEYEIPAQILMENAAANATHIILNYFKKNNLNISNIAIFCGVGNNGGDGLAMARHFSAMFVVTVFIVGKIEKMSDETKKNFDILQKNNNVKIIHISDDADFDNILSGNFDCIIDSLVGVGGTGVLRGIMPKVLAKINSYKALKIAIDMPTGLTEEGNNDENTFIADLTVSITGYKLAFLHHNSEKYCGEIRVAKLGTGEVVERQICNNFILEKEDVRKLLQKRERKTHKFDYGRVLIIAGSDKMCGAAALAANSAIKMGAGIVRLLTTKAHSAILPEVIVEEIKGTQEGTIHPDNYEYILKCCEKSDAIAIGPGVGTNEDTIQMLRKIILQLEGNTVIDADALRCLNKNDKLSQNFILTPHMGEFSRLINLRSEEIEKNVRNYVNTVASEMNCNLVLKGAPTIITNSKIYFWNKIGNPGMATAGSGDVLTGMIVASLAQKVNTLEAGALAVFVHALAGDLYAEKYGEYSLTASNLIDYIKYVLD